MSADIFQVFPERVTQQPWEREGLKNASPAWPQLCFSPLFLMCKTAVPGNNRFFCIPLISVYNGGKSCHLPDGHPTYVWFMISGDAKHLKLTSPKVLSTLPHSRGEAFMWKWLLLLLGPWGKRKKLGNLLSKWTQKTLKYQLCLPLLLSPSLLLHPAHWSEGARSGNLSLPSRKCLKSFWLDEKFDEESQISSSLLPVLLPDFPSCFS